MTLPTEPIGSIPRPPALIDGMQAAGEGLLGSAASRPCTTMPSATRCGASRRRLAGRHRRRAAQAELRDVPGRRTHEPRAGRRDHPVRGRPHSPAPAPHGRPVPLRDAGLGVPRRVRAVTQAPLKQAVISASALSLMYPGDGLPGYPREAFLEDLVAQAAAEIRGCLDRGADVQIDFTEARLSLKLDPSGGLLNAFVDLNNRVLGELTDEERPRVGVHTCPGGDQDSTHSADVDYEALLPSLFRLDVGSFFVQLASEADRPRVLGDARAARRRRPRGSSSASSTRSIRASKRPRRSATASSRRRGSSIPSTSARPTTAASRRSATTRRPRATLRSRRSGTRRRHRAGSRELGA